ncbi:MAG TPA: nuclear transport factor 2 family protein [Microbacteriaceae bacterium]|nr:nuclear transport factor 2 family protein [Microbacteriaceae bacterium]
MSFTLPEEWRAGVPDTVEELIAIRACESLIIDFCDRIDAGDVAAAMALHTADHQMYDISRPEPLDYAEMEARLNKVRFSYEGREVFHVPSNVRLQVVAPDTVQGSFHIALYDLVRMPGGRGIGAKSTEFLGFANEHVLFRLDDGRWKFAARKMRFISGAKQLPIGTLPANLPFEELKR